MESPVTLSAIAAQCQLPLRGSWRKAPERFRPSCAAVSEGNKRQQMPPAATVLPVKKQNSQTRRSGCFAISKINFPLNMPRVQQRRPLPVAETGRNCWGSGLQDASAAPRHEADAGAATRKRRAFKIISQFIAPAFSNICCTCRSSSACSGFVRSGSSASMAAASLWAACRVRVSFIRSAICRVGRPC